MLREGKVKYRGGPALSQAPKPRVNEPWTSVGLSLLGVLGLGSPGDEGGGVRQVLPGGKRREESSWRGRGSRYAIWTLLLRVRPQASCPRTLARLVWRDLEEKKRGRGA